MKNVKRMCCATLLLCSVTMVGCSGDNDGDQETDQASCLPLIDMAVGEQAVWDVSRPQGPNSRITIEQAEEDRIDLSSEGDQVMDARLSLDRSGHCPGYVSPDPVTSAMSYLVYGDNIFERELDRYLNEETGSGEIGVDEPPPEYELNTENCTVEASMQVCRGDFVYREQSYAWRSIEYIDNPKPGRGVEVLTLYDNEETIFELRLDSWNGL